MEISQDRLWSICLCLVEFRCVNQQSEAAAEVSQLQLVPKENLLELSIEITESCTSAADLRVNSILTPHCINFCVQVWKAKQENFVFPAIDVIYYYCNNLA